MKLLIAAICAATSSPVETTLNSLSLAAMSGCAANALAVWIIWMRQVLAMKPLASAMRKGPFLAGNLKNLVLSVQGTKQPGSEAGPATTSGPAAKAGAEKAHAAVNIALPMAARASMAEMIHPCPPFCVSIGRPHRSLARRRAQFSLFSRSSPPPCRPEIARRRRIAGLLALTCQYNGPPRDTQARD